MNVSNPTLPWLEHYSHPCVWDLDLPPLTLPAMFADAAARLGDAPLVDFMGRNHSYRELHAQALRFAAGLQKMGVVKGDRVGLFLPNVPSYIPAYYGAMMAGATVVNFSPLYSAAELEVQVADSGTRLLVTVDVPALLPTALQVLRSSPLEKLVVSRLADMLPWAKGWAMRLFARKQLTPIPHAAGVIEWRSVVANAGDPAPVPLDAMNDLALLQYTGGTTGTPKGAMLTHQNLTANARQVDAIDPHNMDYDLILGALPLFHVFANTAVLNRTVFTGGAVAMLPRFDAEQVFATLRRARPTSFPGVPTMFQALLDHPKFDPADFASLRVCIAGGAPLPQALKQRWEAKTGVRLVEGYGLTETSGVVTANSYEDEDRSGTIGQPFPATRVRLLDREDPTRDAPPGEPGELAVAGPQVMQGYWNRPEAAATAFIERDGIRWLRTGDVAVFEADGYLRVVDRIKDMIAVGGFKVFPSQVEHVLLEHPAIKEALVIGLPDDLMGERPRAFVTLLDDMAENADALRDWLNQRIGKHERVDTVVIREALPKTMIGKLDRKALKEEALGVSP